MVQRFHDGAVAFSCDLSYALRSQIIDEFIENQVKVLVTTDLCTRCSFSSENVLVVVNFSQPLAPNHSIDEKRYILRAGRAGQFGNYLSLSLLNL